MRIPSWVVPGLAAVLLAVGLLVLDWTVIAAEGASLHLGPRRAELCVSACVDVPARGGVLAALALWIGLAAAVAQLGIAALRALRVDGPFGKPAALLAAVAVAALVAGLAAMWPERGELAAGFPVALVGALLGLGAIRPVGEDGAFGGGAWARPIRAAASSARAEATGAARPAPASATFDRAPAPRSAPAPAGPSRIARPNPTGPVAADATRDAVRFVVRDGRVTVDGLEVVLERGGPRAVPWSALVEVVARRLPPDPPFEKTTFVDLVVADGPPLRLVPTSRIDFTALPEGQAAATKDNWRRLVSHARTQHPDLRIEAESAAFFAGGRDAPMFAALKQFVAWDRRYD
jgi:hypothetical protein